MKRPAIFIDRDGTLIEEVNYLSRVEDLRLFPYTYRAIKLLKEHGFLVIVVTNQSGIGRGIFTASDMSRIHEEIQNAVDGGIDAFYHCPHLPCDGCECRKPRPGMIRRATDEFSIDLGRSWMVGDKDIDVKTGQLIGMSTALVLTGYGVRHQKLLEQEPTIIVPDLGKAVEQILASH